MQMMMILAQWLMEHRCSKAVVEGVKHAMQQTILVFMDRVALVAAVADAKQEV